MVGEEFARLLAAAQRGDEQAFAVLWRDVNPAMTRYLRIVSSGDATDAACESWAVVVRRIPAFEGDEVAWRSSIFAAARLRAEEDALRDTWPLFPSVGGGDLGHDLDIDELLGADPDAAAPSDEAIANRGLDDTLAALWALPRATAEVLMLSLVGELPETEVARLVGSDPSAVRETQRRALQDLSVERDLLAWSLAAPASAAELADERTAVAMFRGTIGRATGQLPVRQTESWRTARTDDETWRAWSRPVEGRPPGARSAGTRSAGTRPAGGRPADSRRADTRRPGGRRNPDPASAPGRVVRVPTRVGRIGVAAATAAVVGLVGMGAAAYAGALPQGVQQVLHDVIGAPPPAHRQADSEQGTKGKQPKPQQGKAQSQTQSQTRTQGEVTGTPGRSQSGQSSSAVGPDLAKAAPGLCRAWDADEKKGVNREASAAFRSLVTAAGGAAGVADYCAPHLKKPSAAVSEKGTPGAKPTPAAEPTSKGTGQPSDPPTDPGTGTTTETPTTTGGTTTEEPPPTTGTDTPSTGNDPAPSDTSSVPGNGSTGKGQTKTNPAKEQTSSNSPSESQTNGGSGRGKDKGKSGEVAIPAPVSTAAISALAAG